MAYLALYVLKTFTFPGSFSATSPLIYHVSAMLTFIHLIHKYLFRDYKNVQK